MEVLLALSNPPLSFRRLAEGQPLLGPEKKDPVPARQRQTHLAENERIELLQRYLSGERPFELAKAFDIDRRTVSAILVRAGMRRPRSMTDAERAEAVRLYSEGWSCARIGERLGRDPGTVWLALKAAGVRLRPPWGNASRST